MFSLRETLCYEEHSNYIVLLYRNNAGICFFSSKLDFEFWLKIISMKKLQKITQMHSKYNDHKKDKMLSVSNRLKRGRIVIISRLLSMVLLLLERHYICCSILNKTLLLAAIYDKKIAQYSFFLSQKTIIGRWKSMQNSFVFFSLTKYQVLLTILMIHIILKSQDLTRKWVKSCDNCI